MKKYLVNVNGTDYEITLEALKEGEDFAPKAAPAPKAAAPKAAEAPAAGYKVTSPLPGSIIKVLVSEGQDVKKGDTLLTLESMKMENAVMADRDGKVTKIAVTAEQNVMQDDLLIVLG